MNWRKMDSARRDGTPILIVLPKGMVEDAHRVGVATFMEGQWRYSSGHVSGSIAADAPEAWRDMPKLPA